MKSHKDVKTNRRSTLRFFEEVITVFRRGTENSPARHSLSQFGEKPVSLWNNLMDASFFLAAQARQILSL
jgi:hypothetical protein